MQSWRRPRPFCPARPLPHTATSAAWAGTTTSTARVGEDTESPKAAAPIQPRLNRGGLGQLPSGFVAGPQVGRRLRQLPGRPLELFVAGVRPVLGRTLLAGAVV